MSSFNLLTNIESCYIEIPQLLYYSHIPTAAIIFLLSLFVFIKSNSNKLAGFLLLLVSLVFALWSYFDIVLWTTHSGTVQMFLWSLFPALYILLFGLSSLFLGSMLLERKSLLFQCLLVTNLILLLPLLLLLPSTLNLSYYDAVFCEPVEGPLIIYQYFVGLIIFLLTFVVSIYSYLKKPDERGKTVLLSIGVLGFMLAFSWAEIVGSMTQEWTYTQYGLFSMPFLAALITYTIVKFNAFNAKLIGAQALVIVLWALVGSFVFVAQSNTTKIVAAATLLFTTFAGYLLIRSVNNEVKQREKIEALAKDLAKANDRLKELDKLKSEFVSIASHQLRSPLTSIRGYASMLVEESFGKLPEKALEPLKRIEDSARHMAMSIEDYLNVSRIEAGNMKYNLSEFNLRDEVEKVSNDIRPVAMEKSLVLLFRTDMTSKGVVKADIGKTVQIVHNLINNSMKYTPKGSITVLVHDNIQKKRIYVDIIDTGIGINKENLSKLFQKFSRADNANTVNVSGTGLGLFVALRMAEAMGGTITAHSDGDGKGSKFTLELPLSL